MQVQQEHKQELLSTARLHVRLGYDPGTRKQLNEQQKLIINFFKDTQQDLPFTCQKNRSMLAELRKSTSEIPSPWKKLYPLA